ncbi:FG-GAP-like repeat-containing protein [Kitasatospora sp. NPDC056731]|uniref:FG-GAP-like repeat-containing protein n=1 Tax=Kitasatospora sp. NPDC056731 TaxID=3155422 RepID=UPI00341C59EB
MTAAAVVLGAFAALPPAAPANAAVGCGPVPAALPSAPGVARPESSAWTGSWGTAMSLAGPSASSGVTGQQTLRMVVHTSIGGSSARIHLVNTFSPDPVTIGHVTVAAQDRASARNGNPATAAATPATLTFGGSGRTVVPPGGEVYSDPVAFPVTADENLLVSLWLPDGVTTAPYHPYTLTTSYTSAPGDGADRTQDTGGANLSTPYAYWAFLGGLDVTAAGSDGTVVALGDSQVDGGHTNQDSNTRWADDYGRALSARPTPEGIVNKGISGNRILTDGTGGRVGFGQSALNRFDRDVLSQTGVRSVVLYEGINDITMDDASDSALESGIQQLASRAHAAGLRFTVATIPAFQGYTDYTAARDRVRQCVNDWIRTTTAIDGFHDFDRATRDPLNPSAAFAGYVSSDHLHFTTNGNTALAEVLAPRPAPTSPSHTFSQTTAGAFHGKGIGDLVARDESDGHLYEWAGLGDGSFTARTDLTAGWGAFSQTTAGDFRGTGHADLMAREDATGNLYMWPGNGDGTFAGRVLVTDGWGPFSQTVAGDFRGTGHADLMAREDATGNLYMWPGNGDGTFAGRVLVTDGWGPFSQTVAGDFRGTGHADLMAREDATGNLYMWPGNGDGTFAGRVLVTDGWGPFSQTVAGDFRGTGRADLIARNDTYGVLDEWMNTGGASFSHAFRLTDGW